MVPSSFKEDVKKHPHKLLKSSFQAISRFADLQSFKIVSPKDCPISNCEISISKKAKNETFDFNLELKSTIPQYNFNFEYLGFNKPILIESSKNQRFVSKEAVTKVTRVIKDIQTIKGEISELNSQNKGEIKNRYLRVIVPTNNEAPTSLITSTSFTDKQTIYGSGLVSIEMNGHSYQMFRYEHKEEKNHY